MRSAFLVGPCSLYRIWSVLIATAMLAAWGAAAPAHAQTAQFNYAIQTLGGGFTQPEGVAVDANGNVYVADNGNSAVKEIPAGCTQVSCVIKMLGGTFSAPTGVAVDADGNVYVAVFSLGAVQEIPASCIQGANDASCVVTLGGNAPTNQHPDSVAVDANGNVYVAYYGETVGANFTAVPGSSAVKEIPFGCGSTSCVKTLGGGFYEPGGVAIDSQGNVYVGDTGNQAVKEIPASCISGLNKASCVKTLGGGFATPNGVAVDARGNVYVADDYNRAVKEIPASCISGANDASCVAILDGGLIQPHGVALDGHGNIYVADTSSTVVTKIGLRSADFGPEPVHTTSAAQTLNFTFTSAGMLAATPYKVLTMGAPSRDFDADPTQPATACVAGHPYNTGDTCTVTVTFTPLYAGERNGAVVLIGSANTTIATGYVHGIGQGPQVAFDANPATGDAVTTLGGGFSNPFGVAVDGAGNVYVADSNNNAVEEIPASGSGGATTLGGGFNDPLGVAVDGAGNVYVADAGNSAVKEIPAGCTSLACVSTLGGGFKNPFGVAVDGAGNVYVTDTGNKAVKEFPAGCTSSACVTVLGGGFSNPFGVAVDGAGNVYVADSNDNAVKEIPVGCSTSACVKTLGTGLNSPQGVAVDGAGNVYVADTGNSAVKEFPAGCTSSSCVTTLGSSFTSPAGVAVNGAGNIYIADTTTRQIDEIARSTTPALSFASTAVGATSSDSPKGVILSNIGNQTLSFPVPTTGRNPSIAANFELDNATTCPTLDTSSAPGTLNSGAACTLEVDFKPASVGSITGTLNATDNNLNVAAPNYAVQQIALNGTGIPPVTQLAFSTAPPATITAGGNSGTVSVAEEDSSGATDTSATDTITLTVTGPGSYSQTYTKAAAAGVATFDLTTAALNTAGSYTYTATSGSYTNAIATQTVGAATANAIRVVSGSGQSTAIGTAFGQPLTVKVTDGFGNPVADATVVFTAPTSGASAALSAAAATGANGETSVTATANGTASATAYTVTASVSGVSGAATFSLTNTKATATVTLGNLAQTYTGAPLVASATTVPQGLTVSLTYNGSTTAPTKAGSYAVIATITDPNYTGTATGTLVIGKAAPVISWATPAPIAYGTALSATQLDAASPVSGVFAYTPPMGTVLGVGSHTLSAQFTPTDTTDYSTPVAATVSISVTAATLTVTANDATRVYGAPNPAFTGTITGAVNGDSFTESFTTPAATPSNAGLYAIEPSVTGPDIASYMVRRIDGTLTITKAATTTVLGAGSATPDKSLTLTARVADASSGSVGTPTGTVTFFDGAQQLGTAALTNGAASFTTSALAPSTTHAFTATYSGDIDFLTSTSTSPASVPVPSLTFSLDLTSGSTQTLSPGSPAQYTFRVTPTYGIYPANVSFSVSGLPQGATATFSPATIAANGGSQAMTMTVHAPAYATAQNHGGVLKHGTPLALALLLLPFFGVRKRKSWMRMLSIVLLLAGAGALTGLTSGCGFSSSFFGQQKSYSVTVSATSGAVSQTTPVTLKVE